MVEGNNGILRSVGDSYTASEIYSLYLYAGFIVNLGNQREQHSRSFNDIVFLQLV